MKKHELIINGIYVLKNRKNTYLIILEETKNKIYQTYILESEFNDNIISNEAIQMRLSDNIANHFIFLDNFLSFKNQFIYKSTDGYLGQCEKDLIAKLKRYTKYKMGDVYDC